MADLTAAERLDRTLAIVPWVANQPNGTATLAEISERFNIGADDLRDCLVITSMVGVHPYTPDVLINAIIDALSSLGVKHMPMPASPQTVWRAIQSAKK